jgi:hypothetical protein
MKICFQILLTAMAVCSFVGNAMAAGVSAEFDAANKLYAEGKFVDAAAVYEKILQSGAVSPALYFNYGNAELKAGSRNCRVSAGGATVAARRGRASEPRIRAQPGSRRGIDGESLGKLARHTHVQ